LTDSPLKLREVSPHERNQHRLQQACDLLTQVSDDWQRDLDAVIRSDIPASRAGRLLRMGWELETLNSIAAQVHEICTARHLAVAAQRRDVLPRHSEQSTAMDGAA
jgi:hypothetical protein